VLELRTVQTLLTRWLGHVRPATIAFHI